MLYRHENGINIHGKTRESAHLEFYIDENTSFGWGQVQNSYSNNKYSKEFRIIRDENEFALYFGDATFKAGIYNVKHRYGEDIDLFGKGIGMDEKQNEVFKKCDMGIPYTYVIRYTGVKR